jgi:endonuclease/exonuclease/phosphatase family metal-dependent hydrolase
MTWCTTGARIRVVRAATFNVKHGRKRTGGVDLGLLARTCALLEVDLLALQEIDVRRYRTRFRTQHERIASATGMVAAFGPASKTLIGGYGNALLVRGSIDEHSVVHLPQRSREPRSCLLARVQVDGRACSVAVTHLSTHRHEAIDQLRIAVDRLVVMPPPHLLLGDLNLEPEHIAPIATRGGLALVEHQPTFPNDAPRLTIDHIAFDGWRLEAADVPSTPCSDHRPLVVDLVDVRNEHGALDDGSYAGPAAR